MIRIDILSAVPSLLISPLEHSIVGRARERNLVDICIHDLHDYSSDKHSKIDDYPYGGGPGMVLSPQPIFDCVEHVSQERNYDAVIFTSPDGERYTQKHANRLVMKNNLLFICGHYKGIDQRVRDHLVTHEYSIGDVVVSGGELPVALIIDSLVRLIPEALGDSHSALSDAFQDDSLEAPVYTRPAIFRDLSVPQVLLSGNHKAVGEWREKKALEKTKRLRPDLLK